MSPSRGPLHDRRHNLSGQGNGVDATTPSPTIPRPAQLVVGIPPAITAHAPSAIAALAPSPTSSSLVPPIGLTPMEDRNCPQLPAPPSPRPSPPRTPPPILSPLVIPGNVEYLPLPNAASPSHTPSSLGPLSSLSPSPKSPQTQLYDPPSLHPLLQPPSPTHYREPPTGTKAPGHVVFQNGMELPLPWYTEDLNVGRLRALALDG